MKKKRHITHHSYESSSQNLEHKILENLVHLQKVNIDLAEKFDKLTREISSLLNLFESAAKSLTSTLSQEHEEKDEELLEKLDKLLEQNKTIAKGLSLMEERIHLPFARQTSSQLTTKQTGEQTQEIPEEYAPSIESEPKPLPKF